MRFAAAGQAAGGVRERERARSPTGIHPAASLKRPWNKVADGVRAAERQAATPVRSGFPQIGHSPRARSPPGLLTPPW